VRAVLVAWVTHGPDGDLDEAHERSQHELAWLADYDVELRSANAA
jgi:hypothetical protein